MQFWLLQIDRMLAGDPLYMKPFSILWPKALDCLQALGPQAALPLLKVVDRYADRFSDDSYMVLAKSLEAIGVMHRADSGLTEYEFTPGIPAQTRTIQSQPQRPGAAQISRSRRSCCPD